MDRYRRITRADVARHAGVSETIVSYVVNKNRYVDKEKRKRVEESIKELNYHPNNIARALKGKSSKNFIFIADQITNEHFSQLISEMDVYAYEKGYFFSLCSNRNDQEFVSQIISRQYDGVVISSISFPEDYIRQFVAARLPVVLLLNRDYESMRDVGKIGTGLYTGARECVKHLYSKGRRHILYLDRYSKRGNFSTMSDLRLRGFVEQMHECGIAFKKEELITRCSTAEEIAQRVQAYIREGNPVDAIFGRNDRLACIGMKAVQEIGCIVPGDIAVVGFDNSSLSRYTTPTLTTVEIPRKQIGKAAVEMLYEMIDEETVPQEQHFASALIEREST